MQEECPWERRWLLPFTHNLDLSAIQAALQLADAGSATLVALSLISTARPQGVRLEMIQQSKDFLEATRYKALRLAVALECHEEYTPDVQAQLIQLTRELHCTGIILATRGRETLLLQEQELDQLLLHPPAALVLVRLSARGRKGGRVSLVQRVLCWWQKRCEQLKPFLLSASRL